MSHLTYYRRSKSTIEKACGIVTYKIDDKRKNNLPLLLIVGWKSRSKHAHNASQAHHNVGQNCNNSEMVEN
ncbi:hypothetical protein RhiirA5_436931 [Rhizophagus irregularis]|uniref:Uncharacterized protein n=1 Tax=Rhizophagus irregularis TaxID=588596 RepID=A0A2N0NL88_9GLOM|nr:hypothetical protein RhiirA5_436931 [Rhizophagus irregularis]